jgi:hypothetical protein
MLKLMLNSCNTTFVSIGITVVTNQKGGKEKESPAPSFGRLFQINRNGLQICLDSSKVRSTEERLGVVPERSHGWKGFAQLPHCPCRGRRSPPVATTFSRFTKCQPHTDASCSFQWFENWSSRSAGRFGVHILGRDCSAVLLVDTYFVVVFLPAIAASPEEGEFNRSTLVLADGDIGKFNSDFSRA